MPASADQVALLLAEEVGGYGVIPAGTWDEVRFTGEGLKQSQSTATSEEINPDRLPRDLFRTNLSAGGPVRFEWSYLSHDVITQAVMMAPSWGAAGGPALVTNTGTYSVASGNKFTGASIETGIVVGGWIRSRNFPTAANNGHFRVTATGSGEITVEGGTLVVESGTGNEEIEQGEGVVNGTTQKSYSAEREFTDLTNEFLVASGLTWGGWTVEGSAQSQISGSYESLGSRVQAFAATQAAGTTAANSNPILNSIDHIEKIVEGGAAYQDVTRFSFNMSNNLQPVVVCANLGARSIIKGRVDATGSFVAYTEDLVVHKKYLDHTFSNIAYVFVDANGNSYVIDFPWIKYADGDLNARRTGESVFTEGQWTALKHPTYGHAMRVQRWAN